MRLSALINTKCKAKVTKNNNIHYIKTKEKKKKRYPVMNIQKQIEKILQGMATVSLAIRFSEKHVEY